jgi:hypothetical protein
VYLDFLKDIFSQTILEPFEDLDMRFELKEESGNLYRQAIIRAIKG